jgi:hypothetical protein
VDWPKLSQGCIVKIPGRDDNDNSERYVAWLDVGSAMPPTRCYVEDISRLGAKLSVFRPPVPNEFTLHFNRKGDAKVRCRVTSLAGSKCDVEFIASLAIYA